MASTEEMLEALMRQMDDSDDDSVPAPAPVRKPRVPKAKTPASTFNVDFDDEEPPKKARAPRAPKVAPAEAKKPRAPKKQKEEPLDPRLPVKPASHRCNCDRCPSKF
jgi:hypothetical protein